MQVVLVPPRQQRVSAQLFMELHSADPKQGTARGQECWRGVPQRGWVGAGTLTTGICAGVLVPA